MRRSNGELILESHLKAYKVPFEAEYQFHPTRKWRADFALPAKMVLIEVEGGIYTYGRHNRPKGMIGDMEKYNEANRLGWRILRYTTKQVENGEAIRNILEIIKEIVTKCPTAYATGSVHPSWIDSLAR
jgi:very-short-patch-repair endonuclease